MNSSEKLGYYRRASGISQLEAAEKLDVARQTIGRWEQGVSSPSMENLVKLSELYGVPVDALVKDDWIPPEPEVQFVEVPVEVEVPIEVPVPVEIPILRPRNYRLWATIAAVLIAVGITVGALLFREPAEDFVNISEIEGEVINDSVINEPIELLIPLE